MLEMAQRSDTAEAERDIYKTRRSPYDSITIEDALQISQKGFALMCTGGQVRFLYRDN